MRGCPVTLSELLNSDLSTLIGYARRGYDWWIEELATLVPTSVRSWGTRSTNVVMFAEDHRFVRTDGSPLMTDADASMGQNVTVLVPNGAVLVRDIATPAMTGADLDRMLALNGERYFPLPGASVLISSAIRPDRREDGAMVSDLAAFPLSRAEALAKAMTESGIAPQAVRVASDPFIPDSRFDFLPAMQKGGMIGKTARSTQNWWVVVGIFAALNLATMIWRDSADVERLQTLADQQRPAVAVAQRMAGRIRSVDAIAHRAVARRGFFDPLSALARTTAAIPDGAWVQRYAWDGTTLRLTGYRSSDTDVAVALRKAPGFINVKSAQTDSMAETATGMPFDLVAKLADR